MIARYLARRLIGWFLRLGRTLRGQKRANTPGVGTCMVDPVLGPHRATQEVEG